MPVYELFCLARPALATKALAAIIQKAGRTVFSSSGVLTDVRSFGDREVAYPIHKAGSKYDKVRALDQLS